MAEPQAVEAEAPGAGAPPAAIGAPAEPTEGAAAEPTGEGKAAGPPTDIRALHAGFTQKSMLLASIRELLGLPKTVPDEQLFSEIEKLKVPQAQSVISDDPAIQAQHERLREQQWDLTVMIYGQEVADAVRHIEALALTTRDPAAMAAAFWAAREAKGLTPPATTAPPAPAEPTAAAAQGEAPPDLEMGDAQTNALGRKPIPTSITEGLDRSGNLREAARRLFGGSRA